MNIHFSKWCGIPKLHFLTCSLIAGSAFPSCAVSAIAFENVSDQAGISYSGPSFGASWGDFNGDGWPDLWSGNHAQSPSLLLNLGNGTFSEESARVEVHRGDMHGAAWVDYDNDGDQDLFIQAGAQFGVGTGPNLFFENENAVLNEQAALLGLDYPLGRSRTPLWLDWNSDGILDVLLLNTRRADGLTPSALFSQVEGQFADSSIETGFSTDGGNDYAQLVTLGSTGEQLIFVSAANGAPYPDRVYALRDTSFVDITSEIALPDTPMWNVRDTAVADFDGDLLADLFLVRTAWPPGPRNDQLLIQTADGFIDSSLTSSTLHPTYCKSVTAADFDNDMDVDIYMVCSEPSLNLPNIMYENLGQGEFRLIPDAAGASGSLAGLGDSVSAADYDINGFIDLFVTNGGGAAPYNVGPLQLFRNLGGENHWLEIDLEGVISNREAIGARILATAGGVTQVREQSGGMHRFSQDHKRVHFGLAENNRVNQLIVQWPSGITQNVTNLPSNQVIHIVEPSFPSIAGKPTYRRGKEVGVFLWKDNFDGPYHLEVSGDGPLSKFTIQVIANNSIDEVIPISLEANDILDWRENYIRFDSRVTTSFDGLEFYLPPSSKALISVEMDGNPVRRLLHVGSTGGPLSSAGWILDASELPQRPQFVGGRDLGLFLGYTPGSEMIQARSNGDGLVHKSELNLLFSDNSAAVSPVGFEANDAIQIGHYSVATKNEISTWWDGIDIAIDPAALVGITYSQDNLLQPNQVNPSLRNLGLPNATYLPRAEPYVKPEYAPASDAGVFLWKDKTSNVWHLRATAGGDLRQYRGEIVSDSPFVDVTPHRLENNDELDMIEETRVSFTLTMLNGWEDGIDFEVAEDATLSFNLTGMTPATNPQTVVFIGGRNWRIEQLPLNLSGW